MGSTTLARTEWELAAGTAAGIPEANTIVGVKANVERKAEYVKHWVIWAEEEWSKDLSLHLKTVTNRVLKKSIEAAHKFNNEFYEYKTVYNALTGVKKRLKQKLKDAPEIK